jgi:hypothetical protein
MPGKEQSLCSVAGNGGERISTSQFPTVSTSDFTKEKLMK